MLTAQSKRKRKLQKPKARDGEKSRPAVSVVRLGPKKVSIVVNLHKSRHHHCKAGRYQIRDI